MLKLLPILLLLVFACQSEKPTNSPIQSAEIKTPSPTPSPAASKQATEEVQDTFGMDYIMGKFDPNTHPDFTLIESKYADRKGLYLRKDAYADFKKMYAAAQADGIKLVIRSATRNFNAQKRIWEAKWTGKRKVENGENLAETTPNARERALKILRFSSMPSTSRHHWGTDIDMNAFTNEFFEKGEGKKIYDWLQINASLYGYCQPYTPKNDARPDGYNEEKWHWSYIPIAKQLSHEAEKALQNTAISGFKGAESATDIDVVRKYVLGINRSCLH